MTAINKTVSRRGFLAAGGAMVAATSITRVRGSSVVKTDKTPVIDGMMHLEVYESATKGNYWEGLVDEILEQYDYAGIDQGVILTTWTPSRTSNDRTLRAYEKHPDRFIPFGHIRPEDPDWKEQLQRVSEPPWKGLKLHEGELRRVGQDLKQTTWTIAKAASELGIRLVKLHLVNYSTIEQLTRQFTDITWILPHLGCYNRWNEMKKYCELARSRKNVYLDTSGVAAYYRFGQAFQWAGVEKITFASDGFMYHPLVEKAKVEALRLPGPYRTPRLTDEQMAMVLGGTMKKLLLL
ncbi:MAG: amidohydrolase family protein [Sedimentisphaerales bacterium]